MRLGRLYEKAIAVGIKNDLRKVKGVKKWLLKMRREYNKLPKEKRKFFDKEHLTNPYADTRILYGDHKTEVKSVLLGIDIGPGEVVLADRLREKGKAIDLVMSHHPQGQALAHLYRVMYLQADVFHNMGVPLEIAEDLMAGRVSEVQRGLLPANHTRSLDAARLLKIPFMCAHTVADNCVANFLQTMMDKKRPKRLQDVIALLMAIPEYRDAARIGAGPTILKGKKTSPAGKVFIDMTGGTEGARNIFPRLARAGVGTVIGMHLSEAHLKKARGAHINVIIAGHISSDNVGLNILLDELSIGERLEIIPCSGFKRVTRKKRR